MFRDYRVVIRYESGAVVTGYGPSFSRDGRQVLYAPVFDAETDRVATFAGALVALFIRRPRVSEPIGGPPSGRRVTVRYKNGEVLRGLTRPVPVPSGVWLRPDGAESDSMLAFIPDTAPAIFDFPTDPAPKAEDTPTTSWPSLSLASLSEDEPPTPPATRPRTPPGEADP